MRILFNLMILCAASGAVAQTTKPVIVSRTEWGSKPQPIDDSRKQTPQWITIHHAGELWTGKRDPVDYIRAMQAWGQKENIGRTCPTIS